MAPPNRNGAKVVLIAVLAVLLVAGAGGAVLLLQGNGKKGTVQTTSPATHASSPSPSPTPPALLAPASVTSVIEGLAVTLSWTEPAGGATVDRFTIYRNDTYKASVVSPATSYSDASALPGKTYTYEVRAVAGEKESVGATLLVNTPIPPLSAARLQGDFNVSVKLISKFGFTSYSSDFTLAWHFKAKCGTGACNVTWSDLSFKDYKATLTRKKANYSGSDSGKFNVTCQNVKMISVLTIDMHVTKAKAIDGEWRATKLTGTLTSDQAAQLNCVSSQAVLSITVTLLS